MTPAESRAALVEKVAIAAMKDNGCGLTVDGRHVLCCDKSVVGKVGAYGEGLYQKPENCSCYTMATAALTVALEEAAKVADEYAEADQKLIATAEDDEELAAFQRGRFKGENIAAAIRALIPK